MSDPSNLVVVGSIIYSDGDPWTYGYIITFEIGVKIYVLIVSDGRSLKIIEVSDP